MLGLHHLFPGHTQSGFVYVGYIEAVQNLWFQMKRPSGYVCDMTWKSLTLATPLAICTWIIAMRHAYKHSTSQPWYTDASQSCTLFVHHFYHHQNVMASVYEYYRLYHKYLHIQVNEFHGQPVIHIHEWLNKGHLMRSGITLDEEEYGDMMALGSSTLEALPQLVSGLAKAEDTWSRGIRAQRWGLVVSRFGGGAFVNIRNYWAPKASEAPHPKHIGICLSARAFQLE